MSSMMQLKVTNIIEDDASFNNIVLTGNGSGNEIKDISAVRLYVDANNNGLLDDDEVQVGTEKYYT